MFEFQPVHETAASPQRMAELLQEFRGILARDGMASMDEYGDMLNWGLPKRAGAGRSFHVFDPGFCSFSDAFAGTIHYHGGVVRSTILAGRVEHYTYQAEETPDGDRLHAGIAYKLAKRTQRHGAGTMYTLAPMMPHWMKPDALTITYFEEEDNERMGDLLNPRDGVSDDHTWTQENAEALLPLLFELIETRIAEIGLIAVPVTS